MPIIKPVILITSGGRTGTLFFAKLFDKYALEVDSFHEPDVVTPPYLRNAIWATGHFNPCDILLGKGSPFCSLRALSSARSRGLLSRQQAIHVILRLRRRFIEAQPSLFYCETNLQYQGLLDILPFAFPNSRVVFIVRDGRDWIRSFISHSGGFYSRRDWVSRFGLGRPAASSCRDDRWQEAWGAMGSFERMCWLWQKMTEYSLAGVAMHDHIRWWRFEDVFGSDRSGFWALIDFVTHFPDGQKLDMSLDESVIDRQVHASKGDFPKWTDWTTAQIRQFQSICGPTMARLGYGQEPHWLEMCEKARQELGHE